MGQRHQLFVIARIKGRYRQLCAIHHQWLYGHTALRRCRDTLNILGNTTNRIPIQQELIAASKKDDDFWLVGDDDKNGHVPFPFIMTCLIIGSSFNVDGYYHGVLVERFYMAYDEGDNNNGITVFDISEPDNVRYCFVDFMGMESEREVELHTPLSARTYLEAYYVLDESNDEAGLLPLLESFEGRNLVTKGALVETWPDGAWDHQSPSSDADARSNLDTADPPDLGGLNVTDVPGDRSATMANAGESNESVAEGKPKSLRDQAMNRLLDVLLDPSEQDLPGLMAEADHLHDFIPNLRQRLYDQASVLKPSAANISLLHKALEGATIVDLSPFTALTAGHLSTLVAQLQRGHGSTKVLNLSNMPDLSESDLELILNIGNGSENPSITAIIILETPKISLEFVSHHLGNYDVYHSELFRRPLYEPHDSFPLLHEHGRSLLPALQFDMPDSISQLVLVGISSAQSCDVEFRREDGRFDWSSMKFSIEVESCYGVDPAISYMNFLLDIPLPVSKTIQSLRRLLQYMPSAQTFAFESCFTGAARCFATTSVLDDDGYSVGPLSLTLSEDKQRFRGPEIQSGKNQYLKPGRWAIVLIHEAFDAHDQAHLDKKAARVPGKAGDTARAFKPLKRLRYMLAQAIPEAESSRARYMIVDLPGYIEHLVKDVDQVGKMKTWWAKESSALPAGSGYYDDSDAHAILDRVYSKEGFRSRT
ncbi:MAG: hypothetical protein L6R38_008455 [Xanthoria sp. 2 TBL-2021]|nr:MAG: hypothetical protein L6R38_008455 [Xanthoria sp. 2 TBL-2021]